MYRASFFTFIICALMFTATSSAKNISPETDKNLQKLIEHFDKKGTDIRPLLEDSRFELMPDIKDKFVRAAERVIKDVEDYKKVLGYDKKVSKLSEFIVTYSDELEIAEEQYGIPKEVIVGIIGVESEFGTYAGKYNPFEAYVSMYVVDYRSRFALAQLEELLEFTERNNIDVLELKSSYAGAMSYAQFIPYSLNRWWVGNDLYDMPSNIYSVGKYLSHFKDITGSTEKAILRYNNSTLYQQAVLGLAKEAEGYTK
ncbi:MAG: lytic murein transglycosylase [Balneolaceae bacterium]|nr:lytic murein transglycosylase [Balneolaceae bacterium]MBO6545517.1 lytic murein transglycosylase [Balneolaceae bacterium]MBO6646913.1 lytic murein transglycosylase [Balneolaceae bacterium]